MSRPSLRERIARRDFFVVPGVHDMIAAVIARDIGFDAVYASGYWMPASAHGLPDAGITTYTQMLDRVATLSRTMGPRTAIVADADTGYGGLLNVHTTVRGYEEAGVTAIQLEDQEFPKKCGHTPYKRVVPTEVMVRKIEVACAARTRPDTLIIARSDARQSEGTDSMLRRLEAYAAAGADVLFPEALGTEAEMRRAVETLPKPVMVNMANGGMTPILDAATLAGIGFAFAIFPGLVPLAAAAAARTALTRLKETGSSLHPDLPLHDFQQFCRLIGFEDVWAFEERWAEDLPAAGG